jgi:hypothetical protein
VKPIFWFVAEVNPRNAGYRVRTLPIVTEMQRQGLVVQVHPISALPGLAKTLPDEAQAVFISKPGDTTSHLCLTYLRSRGVAVVVDLFDNYFSWSRALVKRQLHWQWMRSLQVASLLVSSSSFLAAIIGSLSDTEVVQVGDQVPAPLPSIDGTWRFTRKWQSTGPVEVLWFGISGNPYYHAGLDDLVRFATTVRRLAAGCAPRPVNITVCTNRAPALEAVLATLRTHELDVRYVEWTEEVCDQLLDASHVVLLPTNGSGFSLSKTHNRCSDALLRGCLILCSPHGPYHEVGNAVMCDPDEMALAIAHLAPSGAQQMVEASLQTLRDRHQIGGDVGRLLTALARVRAADARRAPQPLLPPVLITARVKADVVKFSRLLGYLTAGFAGHSLQLNYDFRLELLNLDQDRLTLTLSDRARQVLEAELSGNVDADLTESNSSIDCRVAHWHLRLDKTTKQLTVLAGVDADLVEQLALAQRDGRGTTSAQLAAWHVPHVDAITRILSVLGFKRQDMASEDEGGWEAFARNTDGQLAAIEARLQSKWIEFQGNEQAWGRPEAAH